MLSRSGFTLVVAFSFAASLSAEWMTTAPGGRDRAAIAKRSTASPRRTQPRTSHRPVHQPPRQSTRPRVPHFRVHRHHHHPLILHGRGCRCSNCRLGFVPFLEYFREHPYDCRSSGSGGPVRNPLFRARADVASGDDSWQGPADSLRQSRLNFETALLSAQMSLRQGRYQQATTDYLEAVLIDGQDRKSETQLTVAAMMAGEYDLAAWAIRRTLERNPKRILEVSNPTDLIADDPQFANEFRERLSDLQFILEDDPQWVDGWILLATQRHVLDDSLAAELALQIAQLHAEQDQLPDQLLKQLDLSVGP